MSEQVSDFEIPPQAFEPGTFAVIHGEDVLIDTSDREEGEFSPVQESFTGYDASTQLNTMPVSRVVKTLDLPAVSNISHPTRRQITILEFKSKVPLRRAAPAA